MATDRSDSRQGPSRLFFCSVCLLLGAFAYLFAHDLRGETAQALEFQSYAIDAQTAEDEDLASYLVSFRETVEEFSKQVVGRAAEPLSRTRPECGLSNLVADSLKTVGAEVFEEEVDFAITNYGGLRRDMPEGDLTMGLLMELSPFQNYLTYLEIDGKLAWEIAESVAKSGGVAVSGLEVERSEDGELLAAWIAGEPLDRGKSYRLVSIDYLVATWSDLFEPVRILEKRVSAKVIQRDAIVTHLSRLSDNGIAIRDAAEGRVRTR